MMLTSSTRARRGSWQVFHPRKLGPTRLASRAGARVRPLVGDPARTVGRGPARYPGSEKDRSRAAERASLSRVRSLVAHAHDKLLCVLDKGRR